MVAAWSADATQGVDAVMIAYRRDSVSALNAAAQQARRQAGRLTGSQLHIHDGISYQAGDHIIMLAPGPRGSWVTIERAVVSKIETARRILTVLTRNGRRLQLSGEQLGVDRLALGYAVTAHRTQGATHEVVHALEDGGGRELAYVKMSRARTTSHIYLVAPSLEEAADRLVWAWGAERRQHWAIDQTKVDLLAQLRQRRDTLAVAIPPDPAPDLRESRRRLAQLEGDWDDLHRGSGRWAGTHVSRAALQLVQSQHDHRAALGHASDPRLGPIARRRARRHAEEAAQMLRLAQQAWKRDGAPHAKELARQHELTRADMARLQQAVNDRLHWLGQHPDVIQQLHQIDHDIANRTRPHQTDLGPILDYRRRPDPAGPELSARQSPEIDHDYGLGL